MNKELVNLYHSMLVEYSAVEDYWLDEITNVYVVRLYNWESGDNVVYLGLVEGRKYDFR